MAEQAKQKVIPVIIEGFEINAQNVTYQKLQEFSLTLYEKLLNQRKERNFLLNERDKLRTVLDNTCHEIKMENANLINKEDDIEKAQERYRHEMKEVEQEVKFILYDHNNDLTDLSAWEKTMLEKTEEKNIEEELGFLEEKRKLKQLFLEQEYKNEEELSNLKALYQTDIEQLKKTQDEIMTEKEIDFKRNLNHTIKQLTLKHEMEMSEVEERKNTHLDELKSIHKIRLNELKDFFNTITAECLTVISSLKQSLESMKKNKITISSEIKQLKQENRSLKQPLEKSNAEVKNLTRQLVNYEKDLRSLKNNKRLLKQTLEETIVIKRKSSIVQRKIRVGELDDSGTLNSTYSNTLINFKNESVKRREQLIESIKVLSKDLKNKCELIKELMSDPDVAKGLADHKFEYWNPKNLNYELAMICKAHRDLLMTLGEKLEEFCISETELRESDLEEESIINSITAAGAAALVAKQ